MITLGKIATACLAIFFSLCFASAASASTTISDSLPIPPVWTQAGSPYIVPGAEIIRTPVTIEPGVVVKLKFNASLIFLDQITALGLKGEEIIFTAWTDDEHGGDTNGDLESAKPIPGYWSRINLGQNARANFDSVFFLYGGGSPTGMLSSDIKNAKSLTLRNSTLKYSKYAGLLFNYNPDQTIENNKFEENEYGIEILDTTSGTTLTVQNNSFLKNNTFGVRNTYWGTSHRTIVNAQNNWWGDKRGPYHPTTNPDTTGDRVSDGVNFDPWIGKDGNDPVIIIPGIMGSWQKDGVWQIDPIFHTYDNLTQAMKNSGYKEGKDLFTFPYEWRDSNIDNAQILKTKIDEIKASSHLPKVDIVAHSMGGLLARAYIQSDDYTDDVDQLITIGTPHLGAPKDYITWEAAEFVGISSIVTKRIFQQEAEENHYDNLFQYIHQRPVFSIRELLPVYNYLVDVDNNYLLRETYPNNYPRNEFLENINKAGNLTELEDTNFTKIIGQLTGNSTISGYSVVQSNMGEKWIHGYPHGFEIPLSDDQGIMKSIGDRTVPMFSAESQEIPADRTISLNAEHNKLPTSAQKDVIEILTGHRPEGEITDKDYTDKGMLLGLVFSPIDIQIISPSGERIGKNFETGEEYAEIENAFYTGFNTDTEFIAIPNPEGGEYKLKTEGTAVGPYRIELTKIKENLEDPDNAFESTAIIEGIAEPDKQEEHTFDVTENEVVTDKIPPEIVISSPESGKEYLNNMILPITFEADDNKIAKENLKITTTSCSEESCHDDRSATSIDLSLEPLGSHTLKITAVDEAGNESEKTANFKVVTSISALKDNVKHYRELNLIKTDLEKNHLLMALNQIQVLTAYYRQLTAMKMINLANIVKDAANFRIKLLKLHLENQQENVIDEIAKTRLIEGLNWIKI